MKKKRASTRSGFCPTDVGSCLGTMDRVEEDCWRTRMADVGVRDRRTRRRPQTRRLGSAGGFLSWGSRSEPGCRSLRIFGGSDAWLRSAAPAAADYRRSTDIPCAASGSGIWPTQRRRPSGRLPRRSRRSYQLNSGRSAFDRGACCRDLDWHFVPRTSVQLAAIAGLLNAAPLFEEERDVGLSAMGANLTDPILFHGTRAGAALTADDHPLYSAEIELRNGDQGVVPSSGTARQLERGEDR